MNNEYIQKLKDPRWQKKRLEIFERDQWSCIKCGEKKNTLHIHHKKYLFGKDPWEYDNSFLETLCEKCHNNEHGISTYLRAYKDFRDNFIDDFKNVITDDFERIGIFSKLTPPLVFASTRYPYNLSGLK